MRELREPKHNKVLKTACHTVYCRCCVTFRTFFFLTSLLLNELKFRFQIPLINISQFCKCQQQETSSLLHAMRAVYYVNSPGSNSHGEDNAKLKMNLRTLGLHCTSEIRNCLDLLSMALKTCSTVNRNAKNAFLRLRRTW